MQLVIRYTIFLLVTVLSLPTAGAQNGVKVGAVYSLEGTATVERGEPKQPSALATGDAIFGGDTISVAEVGRIAIRLEDGSYVRLSRGSTISFPAGQENLVLDDGEMHFLSHSATRPTISTPHVTAAIRGTEFVLVERDDSATVSMLDGELFGKSDGGEATLRSGQGARFTKTSPPALFAVVSSSDAAQWTVYVPLLDSLNEFLPNVPRTLSRAKQREYLAGVQSNSGDKDQIVIAKAVAAAQSGKYSDALGLLGKEGAGSCSSRSILRGRLLISAGSQDTGKAILESCSQRSTGQLAAASLSTLSMIALTSSNPEKADKYSAQAVAADPASPAAKLARSFVLQGKGDLDGALAALGTSEEDDNAIRSRRAELVFAQGNVTDARELLATLSEKDWYGETILGYVLLGDRDRDGAEQAFVRAIEMEPSAGLPRAGLGIVRMGEGRLEDAQGEFEKAVHLEPLRSSFRSYLAKAYFEADRSPVAYKEFDQAIAIDANDSTPYLYRSFVKLADNEPIAALDDLNRAFELGEKRSTFRSEFLLDKDDAIRSASLARVYRELGFNELGRIEAIRAIAADYTNSGAHRLLSESQDTAFLADGTLSERRISDLFAPLSLQVADSIGGSVSLNEYSELFEKDGSRTAINTFYDSFHDGFGGGVLSLYKADNVVVGASATGAFSDGFSDAPRNSDGRFGLSVQGQPTWSDRYLVELRGGMQEIEGVDDDTDFLSGSFDGAYLHRFTPEITGILQTRYEREKRDDSFSFVESSILSTQQFDGELDTQEVLALLSENSDGYISENRNEAQLIVDSGALKSILTYTNTNADIDQFDESIVLEDELGELTGQDVALNSTGFTELSSNTVGYLGDYEVVKGANVNFGGEFSSVQWASRDIAPYSDDTESDTLWSPKAGLVLTPTRNFMFRTGYAESQGKGRFGDFITIAPTLVGGIGQKFNDLPGTHARTFGVGADGRPLTNTYTGVEWNRRWLSEPSTPGIYNFVVDFDAEEVRNETVIGEREDTAIDQHFVRGYVYQVITQELILGADYRLARQNVDLVDEDDLYVRDQRASLFSRYFWDNGFFANASTAYRHQDRENSVFAPNGSEAGWLFTMGGGYRFPERRGLVAFEINNLFSEDLLLDDSAQFERTVPNDLSVRMVAQVNF